MLNLGFNLSYTSDGVRSSVWEIRGPVTVTVTEVLVLRPILEDRGRITESIRILVPVNGIKQNFFQITAERVRRSQQFQLRRQPVPCQRCGNRKSSVADSSTCPRHDEVNTRRGAYCRSTWNFGNRRQEVRDVFWHVSQKRLVNQQAQLARDPLSDW